MTISLKTKRITDRIVDEFVKIIDDWVADKNQMEKIKSLANEFLFEDIYSKITGEMRALSEQMDEIPLEYRSKEWTSLKEEIQNYYL